MPWRLIFIDQLDMTMDLDKQFQTLEKDLKDQIEICKAIYHIIEREAKALNSQSRSSETPSFDHTNQAREKLLPLLNRTTDRIKKQRKVWEDLSPEQKASKPEINDLVVEALNMIMKIIKMDRANEENLLKNGSIPIDQIPQSLRQNPGAVANIYKQNSR